MGTLNINLEACLAELAALQENERALKKTAVIKVHLDNFGLFNNTFGYSHGDILLAEIAAYLGTKGAKLFRTGGVDFVLVVNDTTYTAAEELAENICSRFANTWHIEKIDAMCTVSVGVLLPSLVPEKPVQMLEKLDYAVQSASEMGQNFTCIYDQKIANRKHFEQVVAERLQWNQGNNWENLELRCRVSMDVTKNKYTRAECYVRLFTEEFGYTGAERFMPVAEKTGMVYSLDLQVINMTCKLIRSLLDQGKEFETIAVPVTAVLFLQENVDKAITNILKSNNVPAGKLALEVAESAIITTYASVNIMMQQLAEMGIEIILTQFGSGFSGINNVLEMPVDALKLDRMLIWELETNPRSSVVIEGLVSIANKLNLKIIAEGVETENQKKQLDSFGCTYQQGFYYSATVPMNEVAAMLPDKE